VFCESALEDFRAVRRQAGRADVGPAESADRKYDRRQAFARFRSFVFVHELPDGRNFGQSRVALLSGLDQYANKTILEPRDEWFASEQGFDGDAAAMNFMIHGQAREAARREFIERTGGGIGGSRWIAPLCDYKPPIDFRWPEYVTTRRGRDWWIPARATP